MHNIRFLIMDVDGTLTDGRVYMGEDGELFKVFDVKDGYAIFEILPKHDIIPVVITARESKIVDNRCKELGITEVYQGCHNKLDKILDVLEKFSHIDYNGDNISYSLANCAFIGDDNIDLQCMEAIVNEGGIVGCPADASDDVKRRAFFISKRPGGNGAVREYVEWIVGSNGIYQ